MNYWLIVIGSLSLLLIELWILSKLFDRHMDKLLNPKRYESRWYISREHYEFMRFYNTMKQIQKQDR